MDLALKIIHTVQNLYIFCAKNVSIPQEAKRFNTPILYTINAHFYNCSINIGPVSFFSSSDMHQFNIYWDATLLPLIIATIFHFFAFFKFNMFDKKVVLIRLKTKTICLTTKLFRLD